mmetsp:Transcript_73005/g.128634  ORF Transcript_73005/g.128634 Transcript_73005/m.128634 type:complete len:89 (+) Transcript_73005:1455-1721(+)
MRVRILKWLHYFRGPYKLESAGPAVRFASPAQFWSWDGLVRLVMVSDTAATSLSPRQALDSDAQHHWPHWANAYPDGGMHTIAPYVMG